MTVTLTGSGFGDGATVTFEVGCDLGTGPGHIDCVTLLVTFTAGSWWFNPTSNHYVFAAESPGDPFVASSAPAPTITGVDPRFT